MKQELINKGLKLLEEGNNKVNFIYSDGNKDKRRLFNNDGLCVIGKGRKNKGHRIDMYNYQDVINIEPIKETPLNIKWEKSIKKAITYLEQSGLWEKNLNDLKLALDIGFYKLQEAYKIINNNYTKDYYENKKIQIEKIKELEPRLTYETEKDKETRLTTTCLKTSILWYMTYPLKIKKMNFGKYDNEVKLKQIAEALKNKEKISIDGRTSYDVSFEYNPETKRAWYSEEYKNCGNGHYYHT